MMRVEHTPFAKFLAELPQKLDRLPYQKQVAFAAACCERAFPNYLNFSVESRWGDPGALRAGIDVAWKVAVGETCEPAAILALESRCKSVTPSSDEFLGEDVTAAQEGAFMVTLLLQLCHSRDKNCAVRTATFARDTIDLYVQTALALDPSDPKLEEKIASHPLMAAELEKQRTDLDKLGLLQSPGQVMAFAAQAAASVSNIGTSSEEASSSRDEASN